MACSNGNGQTQMTLLKKLRLHLQQSIVALRFGCVLLLAFSSQAGEVAVHICPLEICLILKVHPILSERFTWVIYRKVPIVYIFQYSVLQCPLSRKAGFSTLCKLRILALLSNFTFVFTLLHKSTMILEEGNKERNKAPLLNSGLECSGIYLILTFYILPITRALWAA